MFFFNPSLAQQNQPPLNKASLSEDEVKTAVSQIASKYHLQNVYFYLEDDGITRYDVVFGGSDPDKPTPVGSLSKSITGIAIAILLQEHKIELKSTIGELLGGLYGRNNREIDGNLSKVTIERLLTHTAGLRPNRNTDPVNGITTNEGLRRLVGYSNPTAFDFLKENNADNSTGSTAFLYSNLSYLILGMVIEEVSGESYESFCRSRIIGPLGITDASLIGSPYRPIAAYNGWILSRRDVAKIWREVFDRNHPTLLSGATLNRTLFAPLGRPLGAGGAVRYVMGNYIKKTGPRSYDLYHDGQINTSLAGFSSPGNFDSYIEDRVPGQIWSIAISPIPDGQAFKEAISDFRALVGSQ